MTSAGCLCKEARLRRVGWSMPRQNPLERFLWFLPRTGGSPSGRPSSQVSRAPGHLEKLTTSARTTPQPLRRLQGKFSQETGKCDDGCEGRLALAGSNLLEGWMPPPAKSEIHRCPALVVPGEALQCQSDFQPETTTQGIHGGHPVEPRVCASCQPPLVPASRPAPGFQLVPKEQEPLRLPDTQPGG